MRTGRFGYLSFVAGIAVITEACIDTKDRACVDVCPVQCIYEFDPQQNLLFSEAQAGSGEIENTHTPAPDSIVIFGDSILYVNMDECTSCTACYQPDVCPVGAIYSEEHVPDGSAARRYNPSDTGKGHDHTFFIQLSHDVFAD
jgi:Fe-S-cluster-containing hydrogenase component 2